ncbi:hypothetical protein AVEN_18420-1 [Araneus ventricosus]|uniref:Uncharacterized protein n=1 Tax=Araneus ventricosus TaxID=182803 RepID=A0A4Y2G6P2_ARAVE|nr:hypothetical protein AVEN_18420-1 [Araneus ventricosus]
MIEATPQHLLDCVALVYDDLLKRPCWRFSRGDKKFNICTKCNMSEATPQHLLDCVALVYDDLPKRPDFLLEVMKANNLMDLIRFRSEGLERRKRKQLSNNVS